MREAYPREMYIEGADDEGKEEELDPRKKKQQEALKQARGEWLKFGARHEGTINAYFGSPDVPFTMQPGGWYIDLENIRVNADPTFFLDKGYTEPEALFATFHEAEHFRDMIQNPEAYKNLFERLKTRKDVHAGYPSALQRLYNCVDDVLVNHAVMARWSAGRKAKDALYPKLFPSNNFKGQPRHRQLMYAVLRQAMLPDEPIFVDDEVRQALDALAPRLGPNLSALTAVDRLGRARAGDNDSFHRFTLMQSIVEPVFQAFYEKDLIDRKKEPKEGDKDDEPFDEDPFSNAIPDPLDMNAANDMAQKINDKLSEGKKTQFEAAMGISEQDFLSYKRDFTRVERQVAELSNVFDAVIQRRKTQRRVLRRPTEEGVMMHPARSAIAVAEIKAGGEPGKVMLDFESKDVIRRRPRRIEFTIVCDGSGSMKGNPREGMQRRLAVLATEAFAAFQERILKERRNGEQVNLDVLSEVRIFSDVDTVAKPLTPTLTHVERVQMHKKLKDIPGGGNKEPVTFQAIRAEQFNKERVRSLQAGDVKKVILFLTDGESDAGAIQTEMEIMQQAVRNPKTGESSLVIAGIGFEGGTSAMTTYSPNGYYAENLEEVPGIFKDFIAQILEEV